MEVDGILPLLLAIVRDKIALRLSPLMLELSRWKAAAQRNAQALDSLEQQRRRQRNEATVALAAHRATIARLRAENARLRQEIIFERRVTEEQQPARLPTPRPAEATVPTPLAATSTCSASSAATGTAAAAAPAAPAPAAAAPPPPPAAASPGPTDGAHGSSAPSLDARGGGPSGGEAPPPSAPASVRPATANAGTPVNREMHMHDDDDAVLVVGTPYGPRRRSLSGSLNPFNNMDVG